MVGVSFLSSPGVTGAGRNLLARAQARPETSKFHNFGSWALADGSMERWKFCPLKGQPVRSWESGHSSKRASTAW
jgi:hypothetical protein